MYRNLIHLAERHAPFDRTRQDALAAIRAAHPRLSTSELICHSAELVDLIERDQNAAWIVEHAMLLETARPTLAEQAESILARDGMEHEVAESLRYCYPPGNTLDQLIARAEREVAINDSADEAARENMAWQLNSRIDRAVLDHLLARRDAEAAGERLPDLVCESRIDLDAPLTFASLMATI